MLFSKLFHMVYMEWSNVLSKIFLKSVVATDYKLFIRPKKIIVWLSSTTFFFWGVGGQILLFFFLDFFFVKSKSKLHRIIASISPNKGANKSTLPQNYLYTSLKSVLKCKQVENNNLKNIFKRSKFSKKKNNNFVKEFWKLGAVYFCTVKTFFPFSKIRGGWWRTTKQFFFCLA